MKYSQLFGAVAAIALCMLFTSGAVATAGPLDQACVRPDGSPCPPMPAGCVQDNGLPCSGALPDLNAACNQNPVVCRWLIG
jgi:hypothetical protein